MVCVFPLFCPVNFSVVRQYFLLRALEESDPAGVLLPLPVRAEASQAAEPPADNAWVGSAGRAFLVRRTQRLFPRIRATLPALAPLGDVPPGRTWIPSLFLGLALGLGLAASSIGPDQRLHLLSFPLLGVVLWNGVTYLALALMAWRRRSKPNPALPPSAPWLARLETGFARLFRSSDPLPPAQAAVADRFLQDWRRRTVGIRAAEIRVTWHLAAALLAAGLVAGLYLRGLVWEYRAGWESTFLSADALAFLLGAVFGPASWLTGITLPDAEALAALQWSRGPGGNAAPWIHLAAVTATLVVIGPRLMLAGLAGQRARGLRRRLLHDQPGEAYARRLRRAGQGTAEQVRVVPLGAAPRPAAMDNLRRALAEGRGDPASFAVAPAVGYGEAAPRADDFFGKDAEAVTCLLIFVDLTLTPESEVHGPWLGAVAAAQQAGASENHWLIVDEHAFVRHLQGSGLSPAEIQTRTRERFTRWRDLAATHGQTTVRLSDPDLAARLSGSAPAPA